MLNFVYLSYENIISKLWHPQDPVSPCIYTSVFAQRPDGLHVCRAITSLTPFFLRSVVAQSVEGMALYS